MAPWFPGNRRGSKTSLQSSLMVAKIAAGVAGGKVTKATTTGDLGVMPLPPQMIPLAIMFQPPVNNNCAHIQRQPVNPPFTHGMTNNSHHLDGRVPSVASALPAGQRFTPSQCSVLPNSVMGIVRQPMYRGSYDVLNSISYNYYAGGMYPNLSGMYPGYSPFTADYMYNPYAAMQYTTSFSPCSNQYQQDILPMNPIADSASEAEFFPIRMSDSEYTDTGMRSYDEAQIMTAQMLMQEKIQNQATMAAAATVSTSTQNIASTQPKPGFEPQKCAKTQLLKRIGLFQTKTNSATVQTLRPPSDRRSPHSEAPPPSPVGSDNIFNDKQEQKLKNSSHSSLANLSGAQSILKAIKSKFRCSTSFAHSLEKPDNFEISARPCSSSLIQLTETMYNPYAAMQYTISFSFCSKQYQQDLLPVNPITNSASEAEFFPIRMSDNEYYSQI